MKKNIIGFLLAVLCITGCSQNGAVNTELQTTSAANENTAEITSENPEELQTDISDKNRIKVYVNDTLVNSAVPPELKNGSIMLPFRDILNALGVSNDNITWNENEKSISVEHEDNFVYFIIDNTFAVANNEAVEMQTPAYIKDGGITMVPVRFVSEALNAVVRWEGTENTVKIIKK